MVESNPAYLPAHDDHSQNEESLKLESEFSLKLELPSMSQGQGSSKNMRKLSRPRDDDLSEEKGVALEELTTQQNMDQKPYDPNTSHTNALLSIEDDQMNVMLQQLYYSPKCSYFYISLLVMSVLLILVTIFDGFKVTKSKLFIFIEALLNILITADFGLRLKLVGKHSFFKNPQSGHYRWWNIFDCAVVVGCSLAFLFTLGARSGKLTLAGEMSEEIMLVVWAIWQTLRIVLIVKK